MKLAMLISFLLVGLLVVTVSCNEGGAGNPEVRMEEEEERSIEYDPERRATNCGLKSALKPVQNTHSACLSPSPQLAEALVPSAGEQKEIVDYHNHLRSKVQPPASNMMKMVWDEDLATTAQHWASHCETGHDTYAQRDIPGRYSVGQNMYTMFGAVAPWKQMINGWYDEVKDFGYGRGSVNGGVVGHYTQVVAAKSNRIGCGSAKCKVGGKVVVYTFCNYAPAGNYKFGNVDEVKNPYKQGSQCSDCQTCEKGLCVCKETPGTTDVCYNKGALNPNDCACDCTKTAYVGKHCDTCIDFPGGAKAMHMSCAAAKAKGYCKYSNIKSDCCKSCE